MQSHTQTGRQSVLCENTFNCRRLSPATGPTATVLSATTSVGGDDFDFDDDGDAVDHCCGGLR